MDQLGHRDIVKHDFTLDLLRDTYLRMIETEVTSYVERTYGGDVDGDGFVPKRNKSKPKKETPKRDEL